MHSKLITIRESLVKPPISNRIKAGCVVLKTGENVGEHVTTNKEEILIILEGKAHIICEDETIDADQHTLIFIPLNSTHNIVNQSTSDLKYVYIVTPLD